MVDPTIRSNAESPSKSKFSVFSNCTHAGRRKLPEVYICSSVSQKSGSPVNHPGMHTHTLRPASGTDTVPSSIIVPQGQLNDLNRVRPRTLHCCDSSSTECRNNITAAGLRTLTAANVGASSTTSTTTTTTTTATTNSTTTNSLTAVDVPLKEHHQQQKQQHHQQKAAYYLCSMLEDDALQEDQKQGGEVDGGKPSGSCQGTRTFHCCSQYSRQMAAAAHSSSTMTSNNNHHHHPVHRHGNDFLAAATAATLLATTMTTLTTTTTSEEAYVQYTERCSFCSFQVQKSSEQEPLAGESSRYHHHHHPYDIHPLRRRGGNGTDMDNIEGAAAEHSHTRCCAAKSLDTIKSHHRWKRKWNCCSSVPDSPDVPGDPPGSGMRTISGTLSVSASRSVLSAANSGGYGRGRSLPSIMNVAELQNRQQQLNGMGGREPEPPISLDEQRVPELTNNENCANNNCSSVSVEASRNTSPGSASVICRSPNRRNASFATNGNTVASASSSAIQILNSDANGNELPGGEEGVARRSTPPPTPSQGASPVPKRPRARLVRPWPVVRLRHMMRMIDRYRRPRCRTNLNGANANVPSQGTTAGASGSGLMQQSACSSSHVGTVNHQTMVKQNQVRPLSSSEFASALLTVPGFGASVLSNAAGAASTASSSSTFLSPSSSSGGPGSPSVQLRSPLPTTSAIRSDQGTNASCSITMPVLPPPARRRLKGGCGSIEQLSELLGDAPSTPQTQPAPARVPVHPPMAHRRSRRKNVIRNRSPTLSPIHESGLSNPTSPLPCRHVCSHSAVTTTTVIAASSVTCGSTTHHHHNHHNPLDGKGSTGVVPLVATTAYTDLSP